MPTTRIVARGLADERRKIVIVVRTDAAGRLTPKAQGFGYMTDWDWVTPGDYHRYPFVLEQADAKMSLDFGGVNSEEVYLDILGRPIVKGERMRLHCDQPDVFTVISVVHDQDMDKGPTAAERKPVGPRVVAHSESVARAARKAASKAVGKVAKQAAKPPIGRQLAAVKAATDAKHAVVKAGSDAKHAVQEAVAQAWIRIAKKGKRDGPALPRRSGGRAASTRASKAKAKPRG